MSKSHWEVVVGNVGTVYSGTNGAEARKTFLVYRKQSRTGQGRAAGEEVTLFKDGEPVESYWGAQRNPTPSIIGFGRGYVVYPHGIYKKYLRDAKKAAQELADKSGEMARVEREYTNETVFKAYPRPINPSRAPLGAVKAQIRRLPTGQVQIRIPLKNQNPASLQSAMQVVRNLGRRVKSVEMVGDSRNPDSTGLFAAEPGEVGYRAILTAAPGHYLLGGNLRTVSEPFLRRQDAERYAQVSRQINESAGRKVASIEIRRVNIVAHGRRKSKRYS